uniref:SRCR domain-containing protein n=1 Tax=Periophthalmus magnuspinnatus TaxID=409849 RepID=A0A3B4ATP4_9GOBI
VCVCVCVWFWLLSFYGVRLVDFGKCAGRVELSNGTRVCGDGWSLQEGGVVCRALSCDKALAVGPFGSGSRAIFLKDVTCSGNEKSLTQCKNSGFGPKTCQSEAGVVCSAYAHSLRTQPTHTAYSHSLHTHSPLTDSIRTIVLLQSIHPFSSSYPGWVAGAAV